MPQTLKGIKNAFGRFADKLRRRTKKPTLPEKYKHENAVAILGRLQRDTAGYQKLFDNEAKIRTAAHLESMKRLINELNLKQQGCESDLSIAIDENTKQHEEINELKNTIQNYERIAADSDKTNRELLDELVQCQGSKSRKQGSSGRRSTNLHSQALPTVGPAGQISQHTGLTSSSGRRMVKSGSRRTSKLIRSRKPELNTIPELNEPTESSSKRRARIAKQNEMKQTALNFISAHKNAYTQKRKAINNARAAEKAAANQAAANAKKRANNALRNKKLAHIGMMRKGG